MCVNNAVRLGWTKSNPAGELTTRPPETPKRWWQFARPCKPPAPDLLEVLCFLGLLERRPQPTTLKAPSPFLALPDVTTGCDGSFAGMGAMGTALCSPPAQ